MDDKKVGYVFDPVVAGCFSVCLPVDDIKSHPTQQKVRKNNDVYG